MPDLETNWRAHLNVFTALQELFPTITEVGEKCVHTLNTHGKILWLGNGGSAADCQHFAAELVGRFHKDRRALPSLALTVDTSVITAIANDYSFEKIFARQVEAHCQKIDTVIGISTSGKSANVLFALATAKRIGATTVLLTGANKISAVDYCISVPSKVVARIQECHLFIGHSLCEIIDQHFQKDDP